jgi:hypothetical protein
MNLHKRREMDIIDIGLKHSLKNWSERQHPPADGKSRLLGSAVRAEKEKEKNKAASFFLWALNDDYSDFYLERFKDIRSRFLLTGAISAN